MIGTGHPQSGKTLHSLISYEDILKCIIKSVTHVKLSRDIRGRHYDGKRILGRIGIGLEVTLTAPLIIESGLGLIGVESLTYGIDSCHD